MMMDIKYTGTDLAHMNRLLLDEVHRLRMKIDVQEETIVGLMGQTAELREKLRLARSIRPGPHGTAVADDTDLGVAP